MDYFVSNTRGSRHIEQSQGGSTYDMDFYATSYSNAHNIPNFKPTPPVCRDGTGFIRSLVPTGAFGALPGPAVRELSRQQCRPPLPERFPPWTLPDGREPLPGTVTDHSASGYVSNAPPTQQIVKFPRSWRESPGRPPCFMRDQPMAMEHLVKNPPKDFVSEYHSIFKQKPFHADLAGTTSPENPEIICPTGFTHDRGAEGGPEARHYLTPPTSYQREFPPNQLRPDQWSQPSVNNDTRDVGTGFPHSKPVPSNGRLAPPHTKYQQDFGAPSDKETKDHLLPTKISSSGFNSNNPLKQLQLDTRSFCSDYMDRFVDHSPKGAAREGHTTGNITGHTQVFYPLAAIRHRMQAHNDAALPGQQAYVLRSWAARSAPGGIGTQQVEPPRGPMLAVAR